MGSRLAEALPSGQEWADGRKETATRREQPQHGEEEDGSGRFALPGGNFVYWEGGSFGYVSSGLDVLPQRERKSEGSVAARSQKSRSVVINCWKAARLEGFTR